MASRYDKHPLIRYLRDPESASTFRTTDWERLLRSARRGYLLSRVAWIAHQSGLINRIPDQIQFHFKSAMRVAESQSISVNWEVDKIQKALAEPSVPFILLKGAAYIRGKFASGHARLLSDIDILVPNDRLMDAEKAFYANGWFPSKLDAYDQRYYREWMHELPPMQHLGRGTSLDVHHTILPPTAILKPDVDKLWKSAIAIDNDKKVFVLSPVDMVLHSAAHLFHDSELEHGLRDLVDIDALIRQFSTDDQFFETLIDRASELDLGRPLYYAVKYCIAFLQTPIPDAVSRRMINHRSQSFAVRSVMDVIVLRSIGAILEDQPSIKSHFSQFSMYVRSHYLRMPMHLLAPHLLRKQLISKGK